MSWAMIAVGTVAAVGSAVSTSAANKKAKGVGNSLNSTIAYARDNPDAFGEKIPFEAVEYSPLFREDKGYANLAGDVLRGNQKNLDANVALTNQTNSAITDASVARINRLYPGYADAFRQQSNNTAAQLRGEIPAEDREAITARRAEAISLGGGGSTIQQTAADLGLTRMDLMGQGAANLTNNVQLQNLVDPLARHLLPQSSFVDVGQALSAAVSENQFDASFAASERDAEFNAALIPDPQKAGIMNLEASRSGLKAANPQQSVVGNALVAGLSAGVGAYAGQQSAASAQQAAFAQQAPAQYANAAPAYRAYSSPAMQQQGISTLSNTGPVQTAYNPYTGGAYGDQGGLWATVGQPKNKFAFQ